MSLPYKVEPYDIRKLKNDKYQTNVSGYARRDLYAFLNDFLESENDCIKILEANNNTQAHNEATCLNHSIKRFNLGITVIRRGGTIFLVKTERWERLEKED